MSAPAMVATRPLYEYADALLDVRALLLDSEDGELTPEMEQRLDQAVGDFGQKVEQVAFMIRELQGMEKLINDEAERLAARARARGKAASRLKAYLQGQLERADVAKVERPFVTVRLQNNPPAVRHLLTPEQVRELAFNLDLVPLLRHVPERWELDNRQVIDAWKAGEPLPEGVSVEVGRHLRIA